MKNILFLALSILFGFNTYAQQIQIGGTISEQNGSPVAGSTITIEPINQKIKADQDGNYKLNLPIGSYTIKVSAVGYKTSVQPLIINASDALKLDIILESDSILQEVVISASRKTETLNQVPSSINILSSKDIEIQKTINNSLNDILAFSVPGMAFSSNRSQNLGQTMRGRNVLIMIDGIPQSTPLRVGARDIRTIDPIAIERIEVIKGATAIYGNGADGGLINYITKKASREKNINGETTLGSNMFLIKPEQTSGLVFGQSLSGIYSKWDYVVSGRYEQTGLYRDAKGTALSPEYGLNDLRMWNAFTKLGYNINEKNRLELMYNFFSSKQYTGYVAKAGIYGDPASPSIGIPGERPGEPEGVPYNHNLNFRFSSVELIGKTSLDINFYLQDFKTRISYSNFFEGNGQPETPDRKKGARVNLNSPFTLSNYWDGNITYGFDALTDRASTVLTDGRISIPNMDMRSLAPYVQIQSTFFNHLILKTGARFEDIGIDVPDYKTLNSRNSNTGEYGGGEVNVKGGSLNYNTLVFNAGLRYNKFRFFNPFFSFSQSFSIADLGLALRSASENTLENITTKAVKANNYELGFNSSFGKLSMEGAVYLSKSTLGASYVFIDGHAQVARSPEDIHGFEFAADYRPTENLTIGGSYSYTEGERTLNDGSKVYLGGDRINPSKTTAYISYFILPSWMVRMQMLYAGSRNRFEPNNGKYSYGTGPIHSFTTFNLFSTIKLDDKNNLSLGIENLFNRDYFTVISQWQADNLSYVKASGARMNLTYTRRF